MTPMSLDDLLARPGLSAGERILIRAQVLIWPGRWDDLATCFARSRDDGVPRSHVEELLLQAVLFCGFPRVVRAFRVLQESWPAERPPTGGALPLQDQAAAGNELFAAIYRGNTESVRAMLQSYHGELHDFVLDTAYGRILSRRGLPPRTRELIAVGALAMMDQIPQLVAHGRGALNFGADEEQIFEAIYTALQDGEEAKKLTRRIVGS